MPDGTVSLYSGAVYPTLTAAFSTQKAGPFRFDVGVYT